MRELICEAKYGNPNKGEILQSYSVEKEYNEKTVNIILKDTQKVPPKEKCRIVYNNIGKEYCSPLLSWYNLLFCSNNYGASPDYKYMHRAVQRGKKTAATVYLEPNSSRGNRLIKSLPVNCDYLPYGESMIYVFRRGCLADFFDYEEIHSIYESYDTRMVNWEKVREYFYKPMSFFGNEKTCGFSLQSGGTREQNIIIGLLLGYPVESTVSYLTPSGLSISKI